MDGVEERFDIAALSRLAGVNPRTIRTWELRHNALTPERAANGRRLYGRDDLDRLILLRRLTGIGHSIANLSRLDTPGLAHLAQTLIGPEIAADESPLIDRLRSLAEFGDVDAFRHLVAFALDSCEPTQACVELLCPVLRHIGELWSAGRINIAREHALSHVVLRALHRRIDSLHGLGARPLVAFATLSGESHELGALMACLIAAQLRRRTLYLGANIPPDDLAALLQEEKADLAVLGVTLATEDAAAQIRALAERLDGKIELCIGGPGLNLLDSLPPSARFVNDLGKFTEVISAIQLAK